MGHTLVNQAGLFPAGDDVDGETQRLVGTAQKFRPVARFAQRLGGHGTYIGGFEACQAFAKAGQAVPAGLHGFWCQITVGIQSAALAHSLFDVFGTLELAVVYVPYFKAEAVGPQVHSGKAAFR